MTFAISFKKRVLTALQMPLFYIQDKRRVGKSSLITFLPEILGTHFQVLEYDAQENPGIGFKDFLGQLRKVGYERLSREDLPELEWPESWLESWNVFKNELEILAAGTEARVVLAIDEYEELSSHTATGRWSSRSGTDEPCGVGPKARIKSCCCLPVRISSRS